MMLRSIRFRLSIWYFAALFFALVAFGLITRMTMRRSLYESVDDSLRDRIEGVRKFMEVQIEALSLEEIRQEFREHSVLGPGGDLFQVCDSQGNWLYRSAPLAGNEVKILLPLILPEQGLYEDLTVQDTRLRSYSVRVDVRGQPYSVQVAAPVEELAEAFARYGLTLILMIPAVLLVACVGGFWLSRRALAPVDRIIRDAQSISSQNLQKRLDVPASGDELQRLSETLNEMLERLDKAFGRITQFTADASHELRTPVAVIRTTAELALRHPRSTSEYSSALRDILAKAERTTELIDSLLMLARSDTGQHELHLSSVNLCQVIRDAVETGRRFASTKGLEFKALMESPNLMVMGDAPSLGRLALILIDNAIKYTEAPGTVEVRVRFSGGSAVLEIHDSGIGIAPEELPHIFERFYRADPARGSETGGAGLGLAIAHWIVQQHRGEITVTSTPGSGSVFHVSIPPAKNSLRLDD